MTDLVKYFNNSELSINLTSILILNNETNEFEPWFIAKEVATLLGYTETAKAVRTHVDELDQRILSRSECEVLFGSTLINESVESIENADDLKVSNSDTLDNSTNISNRGMKFINESGLYTLIARSNKPEARKFQRWVTSEVLPSIRKTGSYGIKEQTPSYMIEDRIKRASVWIEEQKQMLQLEAEKAQLIADNNNLTQVLTDTSEKLITAIKTSANQ